VQTDSHVACGYRPDAIERYQAASPSVGIDNEMCINACALLDVYRPTALTPGELSQLQYRVCVISSVSMN